MMVDPNVVCLDIGNVSFTFENRRERVKNILRAHGMAPERAVWFSGLFGCALFNMADSGTISARRIWKYACKQGGVSHRKLREYEFAALFAEHLQPIPDTITLMQKLQKKHPLVAVSDGDWGSRYAIQLLQMPPHNIQFLETYVSSEEKIRKPLLYAHVAEDLLKKHDIAIDEWVGVDDVASFISFIKEIGGRGIVFDGSKEPSEALFHRLKSVGVRV